ncbi:hypothetical protein BGX27_006792 [Mortierella sp. AM989]|nr:hypothetical protein BGX27_006792 [Mortierella sp. AM989]
MAPPYHELKLTANDPLSLPEIQLLVATFLEGRDLTQCIRVCRLWHTAFLPCIWENLTLKYRFIDGQPIGPLLNSLQCNRHLVKALRMQSAFSTNYAINYPRLHTLTLRMVDVCDVASTPTFELQQEYDPTPLIQYNPSIVNLSLEHTKGPYTTPFWRAVAGLTKLKSLKICDSVIDSNSVSDFWSLFAQITKLVLQRSSIVTSGNIPPNLTFPQLQELELDLLEELDGVAQLDLIHRCPRLESLVWRPRQRIMIHSSGQLVRDITSGKWPNLSKLSLTSPINDVDLASILTGMIRPATELMLDYSGFGDRSLEALKLRHFATIVTLNLTDCCVSSAMNQEILCSCPRLERFESTSIYTSTITQGEPWACLSLKKLHINILSSSRDHDSHVEVFNRLSRLVRLEDISFGTKETRRIPRVPYRGGLRFKLSCGMGVLESLKRMKYLAWSFTRQNLVMDDIEWMLKSWKGLIQVTGILNSDDTIGNPLREKLRAHGVLVQSIPE